MAIVITGAENKQVFKNAGADILVLMIAIEAMRSTTLAEALATGVEGGSCADNIAYCLGCRLGRSSSLSVLRCWSA